MTNPPSSEYEPVDPSVRTFLWRLRARLVTPPHEERVAADLDRLFLAAREHAHGEPLFGDVVRIDSAAPSADATGQILPGTDVEGLPTGVSPMFGTEPVDTSPWARRQFGTLLGRVAAAAVLLVAVGGGIAGARDGSVNLTALLGRSAVPEVATDDTVLALDADPEPTDEPADEPSAEADAGEDPAQDAATEPADTATTGDAAPSSDEAGEPVETSPTEPADPSGPTATADRPNDGASTSADADSAPEPDSGDTAAPEPDDGDATVTEPVEDVIIAAPPEPRPVDGFGGPTCPEDGDPSLCDDVDGSEGSDPGAPGEGGADTADPDGTGESEQDELARRRGGA